MTIARDFRWKRLEKLIIARVGRCEFCGAKASLLRTLVGHHIIPFYVDKMLEMQPDNIIVLCDARLIRKNKCHFQHGHKGVSWAAYDPDVRIKAALNRPKK